MKLDTARGRVREAGGDELLERLDLLDRLPNQLAPAEPNTNLSAPAQQDALDFDVIIAGGGLSLLYAPLLARQGLRVAVVERGVAGTVHREWNASRRELERLVDCGLFTARELDEQLIVARYVDGLCRWHGGGEYRVRDVLDCAIDAKFLLARARQLATDARVTVVDQTEIVGHAAGPHGVRVELLSAADVRSVSSCRLLVDARGAASPYASADLVCPTVGGVMSGLEEGDGPTQIRPDVGEILVTTEGVSNGHQHLWEAFPVGAGETTVYLFYYARRSEREPFALTKLYARFFERFSDYKAGDVSLVRPTFGLIPGWSRLSPAPRAPEPRVVLVGDAASRHSPLTFCGFGATLRSLGPAAAHISRQVSAPEEVRSVVHDAAIHQGTGALALMLASPSPDPRRSEDLNQLLDAAFATLSELGQGTFGQLLRDEMSAGDFIRFLRITSQKRPSVYADVFRQLGVRNATKWAASLARNYLATR